MPSFLPLPALLAMAMVFAMVRFHRAVVARVPSGLPAPAHPLGVLRLAPVADQDRGPRDPRS